VAIEHNSQTRQLEVLVQVAQLISTLDLDEVLQQTLKLTTEVVGASKGSFFLLDGEGRTLQRFIAARDLDPQARPAVSQHILEGGLAGWVLTNRQAVMIDDTATDNRWVILDDKLRVRSALCVPFIIEGNVRGVMTLEHSEPNHFTADDLRLAKAVANQAEAALRNAQLFDRVTTQQHQMSAVMNSLDEVLLGVDDKWNLTLVNPAAESLLGVSAAQTIGKPLNRVSENPLFARIVDMITAANLSQGTKTYEVRDVDARRDYVVNVATLQADTVDVGGYAIALYDVTSLKDLTRLKVHMLKMASHDLKGPLGLLLGYVDLLHQDVLAGTLPEVSYIESIYKAITRMETLITTLLDAHRSEQENFVAAPVEFHDLVDGILEDMLPLTLQRNQQVVRKFQQDLRPVKGDAVQLREAVSNLISNASKYTPSGGTITIAVYAEDDRFYCSVKDTGYGIPHDQQSKIFQPYFRAKQDVTSNIEGTGVGLSLVKEVIERHGGQAWFTSEEGRGSTFGFWLPLLDPT
jgi:PAS domain S-box-containing protein